MPSVKQLPWLLIALALAVIALLGLTITLTPTAAAPPSPNPQPSIPNLQYTPVISETWVTEPISGVQLYTRILQPDPALYPGQQFPAVVLVPGGLGDGAPAVNQPQYQLLAAQGFIVVGFNAPGRGTGEPGNLRSGGEEDCNGFAGQNALKAVIEYVAALPNVDDDNIGVRTSSYGITMGAGALGRYPDLPVKYLVDMEGPSNSLITTHYYGPQEHDLCGHWNTVTDPSPENVAWWSEREAYRYIGNFRGYYLRAQATIDHAQPPSVYTHTLEMNNTAVISGVPWVRVNGMEMGNPISVTYTVTRPLWLPGRLADYPNLEVNYIIEMARRFGATVTPTWQATLELPHDVDRLENGHILITAGDLEGSEILEVDAEGNVVALYIGQLDFAHNADRLADGHTLLSDTEHNRVIELDEENRTVWSSEWITLGDGSALHYPNDANWLPSDHLLITDRDNHRVIEIDRDGNIIWQFGETGVPGNDDTHLNGPHNADRLDNGNTLIADSNNNRIIEVAPDGTIVWQYPSPAPLPLRSPASPLPRSSAPPSLDWPRDADRLTNGNTLVTDSRNNRIIEVTPAGAVVWEYATGLDTPYDADRLDNGNTLIADSGHGQVIEVDAAGHTVWQYPPKARGTIAGTVRDSTGDPIAGAQVRIYGAEDYSATTDAGGAYALYNVPIAAPRYILVGSADGHRTVQRGDIDVAEGLTTTVNFTLPIGSPVSETLEVRVGYLMRREPGPLLTPPHGAVISPTLYPTYVLPYLEPGRYIESDDPAIVAVAQSILEGVPPDLHTDATFVAHAVYIWMVQNIEYDLISNYPDDVTSGNWQTTFGGWGHSFADWAYTAREVLEERRGICIEHERLTTALLRALGIPARPAPLMAHPVTQWWVQLPDGSGFWANMDTAAGRSAYTESGDLWAHFPAAEEHKIGFWSPDADAPIHLDWWTEEPALWWEHYGASHCYTATSAGLAQAQADLATFAATGVVTPGGVSPNQPHYWLYSRGFSVDLTNVPLQGSFIISFPLPVESITYTQLLSVTHWTNHPEWVVHTYTTTQSNAETGESLTWYVIEMQHPLASCWAWMREQHSLEYENHGCDDYTGILNSVESMGGGVIPVGDDRLFIVWFPYGWYELPNRKLVMTLHGNGGCAEPLFRWWTELSGERNYAIVALQYAEEDPSTEDLIFDDSSQIYENLNTALGQLQTHCPVDDVPVILHGFSRGSARTFELAMTDRSDEGTKTFATFISDSGTGFAETGGEIPPFLEDAPPDAYSGARFWLYCGEQDHEGQTCIDMERMAQIILDLNGTIDDFYTNPTGGHGIFLTGEPGDPGPALTALFDYIDTIEPAAPGFRVFLPAVMVDYDF